MRKNVAGLISIFLFAGSFVFFHLKAEAATDDVTGITLEKEMRAMIELRIMQGNGKGSYRPHDEITRGEFAALIARSLELPQGTKAFRDVPPQAVLAPDIYRASHAGIINGYTDGTFRMGEKITRLQMALMIDNALSKYLKLPRQQAPLAFVDHAEIGHAQFQKVVSHIVYDEIVSGFPLANGTYQFKPQKTATRAEAAAFIYRMLRTWKPAYQVATVQGADVLLKSATIYPSYQEAAAAAVLPNEVIIRNDKIVGMSSGLVLSKPAFGNVIINIYSDPSFTHAFTYLPAQQELEFVAATEDYVKVKIAGRTGFVKQREVSLIPEQQIEGRNYYSVNQAGDLIHWIYLPSSHSYQNYTAGKAPSFLASGKKYISWDGATFFDQAGNNIGTAYQYFNYLPARTKTNYSAEELEFFIRHELARLEELYAREPLVFKSFKDATKKSKLLGLGSYLKEAEAKYRINALMILAMAIHESNFGMNDLSQDRNNLFSMNAIDGNENQADRFPTPEEAIDALATRFLNKNYLHPLGHYANGAILGNKARGFNVKYASDPFWGQKIAGHMYRADKTLGGKDFGHYTIGQTNSGHVKVHDSAEENASNAQFTYNHEKMPVAILEKKNGWYKVLSDHNDYREGYILEKHVEELEIAN